MQLSFYKERKRTRERCIILKRTQKNARTLRSFEKNACPTLVCTTQCRQSSQATGSVVPSEHFNKVLRQLCTVSLCVMCCVAYCAMFCTVSCCVLCCVMLCTVACFVLCHVVYCGELFTVSCFVLCHVVYCGEL